MKAACEKCDDLRVVTKSVRAATTDLVRCGVCGNYNDDEYRRFRAAAWVKAQPPVGICEIDLTPDEFKVYQGLRERHPDTSKTTILMWVEGQRYDPAKDEEWLKTVARPAFKEWMKGRPKTNEPVTWKRPS